VPHRCQQDLHTQGFSGVPIGKNPEDSNLVSVEAMQWVFLYLSISHIIIILLILTANGYLPGDSGNTVTHNTQNKTTIKRNTAHNTTHNNKHPTHKE
jgi:hypothetical protein